MRTATHTKLSDWFDAWEEFFLSYGFAGKNDKGKVKSQKCWTLMKQTLASMARIVVNVVALLTQFLMPLDQEQAKTSQAYPQAWCLAWMNVTKALSPTASENSGSRVLFKIESLVQL